MQLLQLDKTCLKELNTLSKVMDAGHNLEKNSVQVSDLVPLKMKII